MSVAAIRTAVVALVAAVTGVANVAEEQPVGLDQAAAEASRLDGARVHFWLVRSEEQAPAGGVGYVELRHKITVEGYIGVARDNPADGEPSDKLAARLLSAVVAKLAAGGNIAVSGTALGSEGIAPEPIRKTTVNVGSVRHEVHRAAVSYTVIEDAT